MGIFDKLFGRKKEEQREAYRERGPIQAPTPVQKEEPKTLGDFTLEDGLLKYTGGQYDYKKVQAEIRERSLAAAKKIPGAEAFVLPERITESHAETLTITQFFPVDKKTFVVVDLETTGISYSENKIVEIGAVKISNGKIVEEYSTLVDPEMPMPKDASAVNHITDDMLAGKPKIYEVLPEFLAFVGNYVLVGHNVKFDYQFLANACMLHFFKTPDLLFDTMTLARYYPESNSKKLTALAEAAGIEIETAHRALSDARMTAKLILATNEKRKKKK